MKRFLLKIWNAAFDIKTKAVDMAYALWDAVYKRVKKPPCVMSVSGTIDFIVENRCSVSRFGDGEIKLVKGRDISFQNALPFVKKKLREVLSSDLPGHIVCLADIFGDRSRYNEKANAYWKKHLAQYRHTWYKYLINEKVYYNASVTRQYISIKNRSESRDIFISLKRIWEDRDIVFIEGEKSRLGAGNDLFQNARSVRRILGPSENAFSQYEKLMREACKIEKTALFLLALGPCATALAYDLHRAGYQAVDIGHVDVEYEWYLMRADKKIPLENKYVHEAGANAELGPYRNETYENQIIAKYL